MDATVTGKLTDNYSQPRNRQIVFWTTAGWSVFVILLGAFVIGARGRDLTLYPDAAIATAMLLVFISASRLWNQYLRLGRLFQAQDAPHERLAVEYWQAVQAVWLVTIPCVILFIALEAAGTVIHRLAAR